MPQADERPEIEKKEELALIKAPLVFQTEDEEEHLNILRTGMIYRNWEKEGAQRSSLQGHQRMFALRSDDVLVIYEETKCQIIKTNIALKNKNGRNTTTLLDGESGHSVAIKLSADSLYARLILNFANTNEMYEWYGDLTKTISPGDEDVSYEDMASVQKKVSDEQNFQNGPHSMTVKLKSNVE